MDPSSSHINFPRMSHYFSFNVKFTDRPLLCVSFISFNLEFVLRNLFFHDWHSAFFCLLILGVTCGPFDNSSYFWSVAIFKTSFCLEHKSFIEELLLFSFELFSQHSAGWGLFSHNFIVVCHHLLVVWLFLDLEFFILDFSMVTFLSVFLSMFLAIQVLSPFLPDCLLGHRTFVSRVHS